MTTILTNDFGKYAAVGNVAYRDDVLTWGGRKLTEIVDEAGGTPLYVYDREKIKARVTDLRREMPELLRIHYCIKANPMSAVVQFMAGLVDGFDVASAGELEVALTTGIDPRHVSFAGPGKLDSELKLAVQSGIVVCIESAGELRRLARIAADVGRRASVMVRVNPSFELRYSGVKMAGRPSQFGVDADLVPELFTDLMGADVDFCGFHIFAGSQNLRADMIAESMDKTVDLIIELSGLLGTPPRLVNLGGGLGIPYFSNECAVDLTAVANAARSAVGKLHAALGRVEAIIELGRYLVGEAGVYVTRVVDVKVSQGRRFVICDGGLNHHLAASGNFGQVIRKNFPVVSVTRAKDCEPVSVVGPLCTPLDMLADCVTLERLEVGSLVAILQSGAYGKTASPEGFLSHPPCREILC